MSKRAAKTFSSPSATVLCRSLAKKFQFSRTWRFAGKTLTKLKPRKPASAPKPASRKKLPTKKPPPLALRSRIRSRNSKSNAGTDKFVGNKNWRRNFPRRLFLKAILFFRRQFADERPGNFRDLTSLVAHFKTNPTFFIQNNFKRFGFGRNSVGFANGAVRFKKTHAVVKLHVERIFPCEIAHALDANHLGGAKRFFKMGQ